MATNDAGDEAVTVMTTVMATVVVTAEVETMATDLPLETSIIDIATSAAAETTTSSTATETSATQTSSVQPTTSIAVLRSSELTSITTPTIQRTSTLATPSESITLVLSTRLPEVILPPLSATSVPLSITQASSTLATSTSSSISKTSATDVVAAVQESSPPVTVNSDGRKQAFIGGLAGAVGGSFFVVICLLLWACTRRRRARRRGMVNRATISGPRPASPSAMSAFGPYPYVGDPKRGSAKSYKTADGTLIHVDTENFSRPYAEKASWRELAGAGRLHVMNPDKSAPVSPDVGTDRMGGYISSKKNSPTTVTTTEISPGMPAAPSRHATSYSITGAPRLPEVARTPPIVMHRHAEEDFYRTRYARPVAQDGTPREMSTTIGHAFRPHVNGRFSGSDYSTDTSYRESNISDPFQLESPYVSSGARFVMQRSPNDARSSPMGVYNYR